MVIYLMNHCYIFGKILGVIKNELEENDLWVERYYN